MDIVFSANNREEVIVFPYTPAGIEIESTQKNETFDGLSRELNIIGNLSLKAFSLEGYWFKVNPSWASRYARSDPEEYIDFFERWRKKQVPVRLVISKKDGNEFLNMACTIDSFTYGHTKSGDVHYSIGVKEYEFVEV